ncbi:AAA family ATPase [Streptosporangium amethystogenes]|uniref:AAA family ATPase n=1 Tax=Streptosporangium amethystogenes TaxID=2002 RepID=UPI00068B73C7|nr:AAA family ATPase [Streptosporangium amethystogenes]
MGGLRTGKWLDEQVFEPIHEVVPGLIPAGFSLFIGKPKIGKSWAMGGILLAAASGGLALGVIPVGDPQTVMYFALEDGDRRMQDRCRALLGEGVPIPERFNYLTTVPPGQIVITIEAYLASYPETTLLVLDTLGKVMPNASPGESSYQRDYRIGGQLKRIADMYPKLALVVIHHDRKAESSDFIDAVSGTQGLAGSADTIILLSRKRQSTDGLINVTGRDVAEGEYAVTMTDGRFWKLDGETLSEAAKNVRKREESAGLSETSNSILDYVGQHPEGVQAKDVVERFGKDAYTYLDRQLKAGRLVKPKRGLYLVPPVSEVSEVSKSQVSGHDETDTEEMAEDVPQAAEVVAPVHEDQLTVPDIPPIEDPPEPAPGRPRTTKPKCGWCKKAFTPARKGTAYCSRNCRQNANRAAKKKEGR